MAAETIFVQIPAYRDCELGHTLRELFTQARHPERLRVAVAWQYGPDEVGKEDELRKWPNLELLKVPAEQSQGCNWARELLQQRWRGEEFTLFLDSHHRFVPGWDVETVAMWKQLRAAGHRKPIVTGYLPAYEPSTDPVGREGAALRILPLERHQGLLFRLVSEALPEVSATHAPVPACFTSLHFLFAEGEFNRVIRFDSDLYFFVDEIAIALRAFTHGYDLFHPHRVVGWHAYNRASRVTHWRDHPNSAMRFDITCKRIRALYRGRLTGLYGVGTQRPVAAYEHLVGEPLIRDGHGSP